MTIKYRLPIFFTIQIIWDILVGKKRSFRSDSKRMMSDIPAYRVSGSIPDLQVFPHGCLITMNHYSRKGFQIWWAGFAIAAALPKEIRWVITSAWTSSNRLLGGLISRATTLFFKRLAYTYDFLTMPPMPPRPEDISERAISIRSISKSVRDHPGSIIGFAPEGQDSSDGMLIMPPAGAGRLVAHLVNCGLTIVPVGIYEQDETFHIHLGSPYTLPEYPPVASAQLDHLVSLEVMKRITECLPAPYRPSLSTEPIYQEI